MPGRYHKLHLDSQYNGPGDARPTALRIVEDEKRRDQLKDKVVVITGTSSGIGPPTVEAMAATGATIYCTARDLEKGKKVLGKIVDSPKVHLLPLELTSLDSVKAFADEIKRRETKVNILINNAGVMYIPELTRTKEGFEQHIGTNHFAHFYLFCQLRDLLIAGSTPEFNSRVVNVSSMGHRLSPVLLDDINFNIKDSYHQFVAYSSSKTANIHMANQVDRLYGSRGVHGYSLNPGSIVTGLQKHVQDMLHDALKDEKTARFHKSPEQGSATTVWAAVSRELEGKGGLYLENCDITTPVVEGLDEMGEGRFEPGYSKWAYNQEAEEELWKLSLRLTELPADFDKI